MSHITDKAYGAVSDLNLWYTVSNGSDLVLTDIAKIIRLRWDYFKNNWVRIKQKYIDMIPTYGNPALLEKNIRDMDTLVKTQMGLSSGSNPFSDGDVLYRFYAIFDTSRLLDINLTKEESDIIISEKKRVSNFSRKDFVNLRSTLISERDNLSDIIGASDPDYNKIYGRSPKLAQVPANNEDINMMYELQNSIKSIDFILANIFDLETVSIDPYAQARQNANNPDVNIGAYESGLLKRFNYGESLQDIASRELGNQDLWLDIAIANGLKPPYLDEIGEKIPLLSNAGGNQINIEATTNGTLNIDRVFVDQIVFLKSDTNPFPDQRVIVNIKEAPVSGEIVIELDGEGNLDKYKMNENAHIRVFKPNTTNSSFLILIPSEETLPDNRKNDTPWFLRKKSESEKRQGVDLLLNDNADLVLSSSGDVQLSFGISNSIQAVKLKMSIEPGELPRHEDYGLTPVQGYTNSNTSDVGNVLVDSINSAIAADSRFDRVEKLDVNYFSGRTDGSTGNGFDINLVVRLAGSEQMIPITFSVNI